MNLILRSFCILCFTFITNQLVAQVDAVDDNFSGKFAGDYVNLYANDSVPNGGSYSIVSSTMPGATIEAFGDLYIPGNVPPGNYTIVYRLCDTIDPAQCDTATATISVSSPTVVTQDDTYTAGGWNPSILANDTLNGQQSSYQYFRSFNVTVVSSDHPGITIKTGISGEPYVDVATSIPPGTYTLVYQACDAATNSICSSSKVTVIVPGIYTNYDRFTIYGNLTVPSIFTNDAVNGQPVNLNNVIFTIINVNGVEQNTLPAGFTLNNDGTISIAPGTADSYLSFTYQICDPVNPDNCSSTDVWISRWYYGPCKDPMSGGKAIPSVHGITSLGRAGDNKDGNAANDWPMARGSAFTVLESKTKPFVVNRMADPAASVKEPVEGMMVYDTTDNCLKIYVNGAWRCYNIPTCLRPTEN